MTEKIEVVLDNNLWKILPLDGYEHYWISRRGEVYNSKTKKIMKQSVSNVGYKQCCLHSFPKGKTLVAQVGRLVALAHVPNPNPEFYKEVNHKDNNPLNNNADNLEWCNRSMNCSTPEWKEKRSKIITEFWADKERSAKAVENRKTALEEYWRKVKSGEIERKKYERNGK